MKLRSQTKKLTFTANVFFLLLERMDDAVGLDVEDSGSDVHAVDNSKAAAAEVVGAPAAAATIKSPAAAADVSAAPAEPPESFKSLFTWVRMQSAEGRSRSTLPISVVVRARTCAACFVMVVVAADGSRYVRRPYPRRRRAANRSANWFTSIGLSWEVAMVILFATCTKCACRRVCNMARRHARVP